MEECTATTRTKNLTDGRGKGGGVIDLGGKSERNSQLCGDHKTNWAGKREEIKTTRRQGGLGAPKRRLPSGRFKV